MKKLLSIFAAFGMTATPILGVVSCENKEKNPYYPHKYIDGLPENKEKFIEILQEIYLKRKEMSEKSEDEEMIWEIKHPGSSLQDYYDIFRKNNDSTIMYFIYDSLMMSYSYQISKLLEFDEGGFSEFINKYNIDGAYGYFYKNEESFLEDKEWMIKYLAKWTTDENLKIHSAIFDWGLNNFNWKL